MVDRCNSTDNFLSNRTTTFAEKIDSETLVSSMLKGSMTSSRVTGSVILGREGVRREEEVNKEAKKLLAPVDFTVLDTGVLRGFSDPEEYTHRITSALTYSAVR